MQAVFANVRRYSMARWTALACTSLSIAAAPQIEKVSPPVWQAREPTRVVLSGKELNGPVKISLHNDAEAVLEKSTSESEVAFTYIPKAFTNSIAALRVATTNGVSNLELIPILDGDLLAEAHTNTAPGNARPITLPSVVTGTIGKAATADYYALELKRNEQVTLEVFANRVGSTLDPVVRIFEATDHARELLFNDDDIFTARDPRATFKPSKAGRYLIEVRDVAFTGGPKHFYALHVSAAPPESKKRNSDQIQKKNHSPETAMRIELTDARQSRSVVDAEFTQPSEVDYYAFESDGPHRILAMGLSRLLGSPCDVRIRLLKEDHELIAESTIADTDDAILETTLPAAGKYILAVTELNRRGAPGMRYQLNLSKWTPGLNLTTDIDKIDAAPGETITVKVTARRRGYDGPIRISASSLEASSLENNTIPEKKTETDVKIKLPDSLPVGDLLHLELFGEATDLKNGVSEAVSMLPAFRKQFQFIVYAPIQPLNRIAVGIKGP